MCESEQSMERLKRVNISVISLTSLCAVSAKTDHTVSSALKHLVVLATAITFGSQAARMKERLVPAYCTVRSDLNM